MDVEGTSKRLSGGVGKSFVADPKFGPLPALMVILTVTTGVVDSVSILSLGRVFVANMTGNVVFVGFALAKAPGFSLSASLFALAGFLVGAFGAGSAIPRYGGRRSRLFRSTALIEAAMVAAALVVACFSKKPLEFGPRDSIAALLALAMGAQNAVARRLAVPDLTTTVLTMTLTGMAADVRTGKPTMISRRLAAVIAMFTGAVGGALLVLHVGVVAGLSLATGLLTLVALLALLLERRPGKWQSE